jgi:hypothetical protein
VLGDVWGATDAETRGRFPCDAYVKDPSMIVWRSVTIKAPVHDVWPWLVQLRLAPYSYDWLDNLGRRSHEYGMSLRTRTRTTTSWPPAVDRSGSSSRSILASA